MSAATSHRQSNGSSPAARRNTSDDSSASGEYDGGSRAPLDVMLTDASTSSLRRWAPGPEALKWVAAMARNPRQPVGRLAHLGKELGKIAIGRSDVAPGKKDKRFADPAWTQNPLYNRLCQTYLAASKTAEDMVVDADLDWRAQQRLAFLVENAVDALAPSNLPTNPMALKVALDTGGRSYVRGARRLVHDLRRKPHIPQMVDSSPFTIGENIAVTEGAVVLRTDVIELIQYRPRTEQVHARPLLLVPPMINKFYIADLAPDRSMIQFFLDSGQPVYAISWRNPTAEHRDWNLDTYAQAVLDALAAVEKIAGATDASGKPVGTHLLGLCAGGITASCVAAHLAARGQLDRIASLTLGVTVLDQSRAGLVGSLVDEQTAKMSIDQSQRQGFLDGKSLAGVFAWLRPNDLIWNYWVNNYLLGKPPPAFDVLFWNNDVTRMPAGLHRDFLHMSLANKLVDPGSLTVLGTPIDLSTITVDTYLVAGIADHITPWHNNYKTIKLVGSRPRFVLSTSGHIAALVNPPGNPKSTWQVNDALPDDPDDWLAEATTQKGSWWTDFVAWIAERSGGEHAAPTELGGNGYTPVAAAPGTYVLES
ncbi:MAG TPA: alpha/beta fold hydrolase [Frankiaceae bacterium]|nr:alpha/beta fold hydrolase [Frankiaceae bacterium]